MNVKCRIDLIYFFRDRVENVFLQRENRNRRDGIEIVLIWDFFFEACRTKKKRKKTVEEKRLGNDFKEERRKLKDLFTLITKKKRRSMVKTHLLHLAAIDFQLSIR